MEEHTGMHRMGEQPGARPDMSGRRQSSSGGGDGGGGGDDWIITYSDAVTLLLGFFVMLLSVSEPKQEQLQAIAESIQGKAASPQVVAPVSDVFDQLSGVVNKLGQDGKAKIIKTKKGIVIEFSAEALFKAGAANIHKKFLPQLAEIGDVIRANVSDEYSIEVEGHTDDTPAGRGSGFKSNWELSAARATGVVRVLIEQGISPERFKAVGLADTRPAVPNVDLIDGTPIPGNRKKNRRVVVRVER